MRAPRTSKDKLRLGALGLVLVAATLSVVGWLRLSESDYSNIYPGDYVGPKVCGQCHETNFGLWKEHSHRRMNLSASEDAVLGDFSGVKLPYGRGYAQFERQGSDYTMAIFEGARLIRRHRVTRTVGSLYMQYYIGQQIFGPEPPNHLTYSLESKLPFAYCFALKRWLPEHYLDSTSAAEQAYLDGHVYIDGPPMHNWNISCMTCHNTYPYIDRLWHQPPPNEKVGLWQGGFLEAGIQTTVSRVHQGGLALGPSLRGIDASKLVTLGISCESCHFGGREHAIKGRRIRFVPTSPDVTVRRPGSTEPLRSNRKDAYIVNSICAQCHNSQLDVYPNGASAVNSNEATDLVASACASQIKCTDCHNPHRRGPRSGSPDQPAHVAACVQCHKQYATPQTALAHSRHSESSQVSCLDCHMPRIVAGLDTVTRTHRIGSPVDVQMLAAGGPNACNLCHLDRPIRWTLDELSKGWGQKLTLGDERVAAYGGSFTAPLGERWLMSPNKFVRLSAADAYARSPLVKDRIPYLLTALNDTHAFNRTLALISLEKILGRRLTDREYDLLAPAEERKRQLDALASSGTLSAELHRHGR